MNKLTSIVVLSLAALGLDVGRSSAFGWHHCCHPCSYPSCCGSCGHGHGGCCKHKCCGDPCCRPYNAFSDSPCCPQPQPPCCPAPCCDPCGGGFGYGGGFPGGYGGGYGGGGFASAPMGMGMPVSYASAPAGPMGCASCGGGLGQLPAMATTAPAPGPVAMPQAPTAPAATMPAPDNTRTALPMPSMPSQMPNALTQPIGYYGYQPAFQAGYQPNYGYPGYYPMPQQAPMGPVPGMGY